MALRDRISARRRRRARKRAKRSKPPVLLSAATVNSIHVRYCFHAVRLLKWISLPGGKRLSLMSQRRSSLQSYLGVPNPTGCILTLLGTSPRRTRSATRATWLATSTRVTSGPPTFLGRSQGDPGEYGGVGDGVQPVHHVFSFVRNPCRINRHHNEQDDRPRRKRGGALEHVFEGQFIMPRERHTAGERLKLIAYRLHRKLFIGRVACHHRNMVCCRQ